MIQAVLDRVSPLWATFLVLLFSPTLFAEWAEKLPILGRLSKKLRGWLSRNRAKAKERSERAVELERLEATRTESYRRQEVEIERLSKQYDRLADDFRDVVARVDDLEAKLTLANRRFFAAVTYIRDLMLRLRSVDPSHDIPEPPDLIKDAI